MPSKFEKWMEDQPEDVKTMFEEHVTGLKTALQSERDGRKDDLKKLRELEKQAETGSDLGRQLAEMTKSMKDMELRTKFIESAGVAGVKANLVKAAYLTANADGLVSEDKIDFEGLKTKYPDFFGSEPQPRANAAEQNQANGGKLDMNDWVRTKLNGA